MADSTPLLTKYDSNSTHKPHKTSPDVSFEEMIEPYMRSLGWPQLLQIILVNFACFFEAQQTFISIFTDVNPTWHCTQQGNTTCFQESNICDLPITAWSWNKPAYTSVVSEWSLQCAGNSIIIGLPASSYFMGSLLGGLVLFLLGDSFGRKQMLFLSCFIMSVASIFTAFSDNVWIYSALRFLSGFNRAGIGTCALVLATESVGERWKGQVGTIGFFMSTLGFLSLSILAFLNRNYSWRALYLLTSMPAIVYCLLIQFCVYESPRWLFAQGRNKEAFAVLNTFFSGVDFTHLALNLSKVFGNEVQNLKAKKKQSLIKMLLKRKSVLRYFLLTLIIGFGIGVSYYGMPLGIGNMDFDIYLNAAFNALLELPSCLLILFTVSKWRRGSSMVALTTIGGACGLICFILGKYWQGSQVGLELISFFCATTAFDLLLIYTSELIPTCFRNSAVSTVWQSLVFGGVISPVLIAAAENYNNLLPYGIFGVMMMALGSLVTLLPETLGAATMVDSMDEQEQDQSAASYAVDRV